MRRRGFITLLGGVAAAWPLAARSQQSDRMPRIGMLIGYAEDDPEVCRSRQAGMVGKPQRSDRVSFRSWKLGSISRAREGADRAASRCDSGAHHSGGCGIAAETHTVPIVFVNVSDPIGSGLIVSMARPGGNVTGVLHYEASIVGKWLGFLKEIAPNLMRIGLLGNPNTTPFDYFLRSAQAVAGSLSVEVIPHRVNNSAVDIERTLSALASLPDSGLLVAPDATTVVHRDQIIELAARHRLPAVYPFNYFVASGGLLAYGTDQLEMFRQTANYVDRILRGVKPADLPVQAPTRYETSVNLKTAKALGLTVPNGLLVAADEVIE
jgi:putative tryptophan/tyrosine transport system substrate-binding protein